MSTPNFLQIKPNGINLPSNASTVVASAGDMAYNSAVNKYAIYNTAADFLVTEATASSTITNLTNANLSGSAGITNANLASMANNTIKGNKSGSSATPSDVALGSLTEATSSVLTITGTNTVVGNTTIQVSQASGSTSGYLSSTDWTTFNSKQGSGNYITSLTGDVTAAGPGAAATTLTATTNSTLTTLSGLTTASSLASVGTITSGTWNATTIAIAHGGTGQVTANAAFNALSPMTTNGDMIYLASGVATRLATPVTNNEILTSISGTPTWTSIASLPIPQGTKNYLTQYTASTSSSQANAGNGNFELGNTSGWSLGTIGTLTNGLPTGTPTFGSGASGNLSLNVLSSGNQIGGSYSGEMVSSAASTVGNMMASSAFFIDAEDQGKVLTFKFYYSPIVGATNLNFSGTSSNSFGVAVWDVTNSTWIPVAGAFSMTQSTGVGLATGTFQTNINTASMRFVIYNVNASLGAYNLALDDIFVGPQTAPIGPVVTDWVAYTPTFTGLGTVTAINFASKRVGDCLEIQGTFTSGTTTGVNATFTLGYNGGNGNVVGDTTKFSASTELVGYGAESGVSSVQLTLLASGSNNFLYIGGQGGSNAGLTALLGSSMGSNTTYSFFGRLPIVGWSSNVQMSSDTDTRVITARYSLTTAQAVTAGNPLKYDTLLFDTPGMYNISTGLFTAPVSGYYKITAVFSASTPVSPYILTSSGYSAYMGQINSANNISTAVGEIKCNAGDTFGLYPDGSVTFVAPTTHGSVNTISVERLSGPAVIAATESVNMNYGGTSATTGTAGQYVPVPCTTKLYDSHNAYNTSTGAYTIPVSGKYRVTFQSGAPIQPTTVGNSAAFYVAIGHNINNGPTVQNVAPGISTSFVTNYIQSVTSTFNCLAGDTIYGIVANELNSTNNISLFSSTQDTFICIERVGN